MGPHLATDTKENLAPRHTIRHRFFSPTVVNYGIYLHSIASSCQQTEDIATPFSLSLAKNTIAFSL